ncbi:MAG: hypothetical protein V4549_03625 [Bacteroidota bacterium]
MKVKKIFKYPTGTVIPEGASYLSTITQTSEYNRFANHKKGEWIPCWYVWHYFLVEVEEKEGRLRNVADKS